MVFFTITYVRKDVSMLWLQNPDLETQNMVGYCTASHINGPGAQSQRHPVVQALNSFLPLLKAILLINLFFMESDILFCS